MLSVIPRPVVTTYKIRRAWTQEISYSPGNGFFAASFNIQLQFGGSVSNINLGGVGVYGPTLPNSSEFSALFDQWRINKVTLRADWNSNSVATADVNNTPPILYIAPDYDDGQDANVASLLQYPAVRTHSFLTNGYAPMIYSLLPRPLKDVAGTGISTGYSVDTSHTFLRTADLTIPHYGIKIATLPFGATSTTVTGRILFTCYVDLEFANPK